MNNNDDNHQPAPLRQSEMHRLWHDYAQEFTEGPIGRGIYALQLLEWMKELKNNFGRLPNHVLKIIRLVFQKMLQ